jgi:AraC-like DNA-binding protein
MFSGLRVKESVRLSWRDKRFLQEAMDVVEHHLTEEGFNVTELSSLLGTSRVTIHRRLKSATGQSTSEFIRSIKLHHAAHLLKDEGMPVRQAARFSGFNNLSYFSKCFRKEFGIRPSEYLTP